MESEFRGKKGYIMADIARNIRQQRIQHNLTQTQLAEKLGVTRQTVSSWERGNSFPSLDMLERLAAVLGTDLDQFLYPAEKPKSAAGRPLGFRFLLFSLLAYVLVWYLGMPLVLPLCQKLFGDGVWESFLYPLYWAVLLLVGYVGVCVCLLSEQLAGLWDRDGEE